MRNLGLNIISRLKGLFNSEGTLSEKMARGGAWVLLSYSFQKMCFFVRTIILVRLLSPEDFGLMGIALLATTIITVFTETGMGSALIQRKECNEDALNTAWIISLFRGVLLFLILFFSAPLIAGFYNNTQITAILKVIAFSFLLGGCSNIGLILLQKELDFRKKVLFDQTINLINIIFSIFFAFIFRNVWAFVLAQITASFLGMIGSYLIQPFRPGFRFNVNIARELICFGKYIFASSILTFLITQGDDALVGKVLGMSALGFYVLAYNFSNLPTTAITHIISQVTFPAYAKLQNNIEKLKIAYLEILKLTVSVSAPLSAGIFFIVPGFAVLFLGERWMPIVVPTQLLVIWGFVRSIGATTGPVFQAVGKPQIIVWIQAAKLIILMVTIYPLTKYWGIVGTSIAVVFNAVVMHPFADYFIIKVIKCKVGEFIKTLMLPIVISVLMIFFLQILKGHVFIRGGFFDFFALMVSGMAFYLAGIYVCEIKFKFGLKDIILRRIKF